MQHHFAHDKGSSCDEWGENEGNWHLSWKKMFEDFSNDIEIEKCIKKMDTWHFADVCSNKGVIELQHSSISTDTIMQREEFYEKMVWLFDCIKQYEEKRLFVQSINDVKKPYVKFRWIHPRKSLFYARKVIFLDIGNNNIIYIKKFRGKKRLCGWGYMISYNNFLKITT